MPLPTADDLRALPSRYIVAYAARCARRVRPLYRLPHDHPRKGRCEQTVERGITLAEAFADGTRAAAGLAVTPAKVMRAAEAPRFDEGAARAAEAAALALKTAAAASDEIEAALIGIDAADVAVEAVDAAVDAAVRAGDDSSALISAAEADYRRMLTFDRKHPSGSSPRLDPGEKGQLGTLWPRGKPIWLVRASMESKANALQAPFVG